jgi:hypothetical protein
MPDLKSLPPFDLAILGGGLLTFIASFLPWYGFKFSGVTIGNFHEGGASGSVSAWHSYSTLALLLVFVGVAFAAVAIFSPTSLPTLPVGPRWIAAGLVSLGTLLELLRLLTVHHGDGYGIRWGGYFLALVMIATAAAAVISALSSDEAVPWQQSGGATPPPPPVA